MIDSVVARYQSLDAEATRLTGMPTQEAFAALREDPTWRERVADRLYCEARVYHAANNVEAALSAAAESLRRDPDSPLSWALWIFHTEGGYGRCELLSKLVERWPTLASLRKYDAFAWLQAGQFEYAAEEWRVALTLDPQGRDAWLSLAATLILLRDRQGAADATERALTIPTDPSRVTPLASMLLWSTLRYGRAFDVARERARQRRTPMSVLLPWILPAIPFRTSTRIWWFTALFLYAVALIAESPSGPIGVVAWSVFAVLAFLYVAAGRAVSEITGSLRKRIARSANVPLVPERPGYLTVQADAGRRPEWARPNPVRVQALLSLVVLVIGTILIADVLSPSGNGQVSLPSSPSGPLIGSGYLEVSNLPDLATSSGLASGPPAIPFEVGLEGPMGAGPYPPALVNVFGFVQVPDCKLWHMDGATVSVWDTSGSLLLSGPTYPDPSIVSPACRIDVDLQTSVQGRFFISVGPPGTELPSTGLPALYESNDPRVGWAICVVQGTGPCPPLSPG